MAYAELLDEAARLNGEGAAFGGATRRSWADVRAETARIAGGLARRLGLKPGARVAVLMGLSQDQARLTFALSWLGLTVVPLNTRLGLEDMGAVVSHADVEALFWDPPHAERAADLARDAGVAISARIDATALEDLAGSDPLPRVAWDDTDVAALIFTGGTTGTPKGVMLTPAAMRFQANIYATEMNYSRETVYLHAMPIFHVGGLGQLLGLTLRGGCHLFHPEGGPAAIYAALRDEGLNTICGVPTALAMLLDSPLRDDALLARIQAVGYGASSISEALLERLLLSLPNAGFRQFYGQTESAGTVSALRPPFHVTSGPNAGRLTSCGQACDGFVLETHDAQGKATPHGVPGEVVVRGEHLPPGYWRDPERTAELYRGGWMHTGDIGVLDADGFLTIVDRLKDMIVTGGENVFCTEVENAIARHPAVAECAVVGLPHELWGEAVHAVIVLRPGVQASEAELTAYCGRALTNYKRPKSIEIANEPLPLSGVGKVMKNVLRERCLANRPQVAAHA
ncbi:MAG: AMP-binding protein [Brevundimonas sp.]|uniref:class I adenylate-forming enzyme family protein n=1 Tax=Brevundimonas sp. TaxID=1871086 RepID=UPI002733ED15|nr:AMP-binding protein [Brevundimonas sp.]MDP3403456.1 AMP-binding protein [Brevundimonas sp.]